MKPYDYVGEWRKWARIIQSKWEEQNGWQESARDKFYTARLPLASAILGLGENATGEQVGALIDAQTLTRDVMCDNHCQSMRHGGVEFDDDTHYYLCTKCVREMAVMAGLKIEDNK